MGALLDRATPARTDSRQAAINALAYTDDVRASALIAEMIKSGDPALATTAISASHAGGRDVDQALLAALGSQHEQVRTLAAHQLRSRGSRLSAGAQRMVEAIISGRTSP